MHEEQRSDERACGVDILPVEQQVTAIHEHHERQPGEDEQRRYDQQFQLNKP